MGNGKSGVDGSKRGTSKCKNGFTRLGRKTMSGGPITISLRLCSFTVQSLYVSLTVMAQHCMKMGALEQGYDLCGPAGLDISINGRL